MKKIKIILLILFCNGLSLFTKGQVIIRLTFICNIGDGHNTFMNYILNDINELDSIKFKGKIDQTFLAGMFKLPLVETGGALENCIDSDTLDIDITKLFNEKVVYKMETERKNFTLQISILNVTVNYCTFPLNFRYWTTCDAHFIRAATIVSKPILLSMTEKDTEIIERFKREINRAKIVCGE
jgi:hypothetical protein